MKSLNMQSRECRSKNFILRASTLSRANWYLRTTISAGWRVAVDLRFMQRHGPT